MEQIIYILKLFALAGVSFFVGVFVERAFGGERIIYVKEPEVTCKTCEEGERYELS